MSLIITWNLTSLEERTWIRIKIIIFTGTIFVLIPVTGISIPVVTGTVFVLIPVTGKSIPVIVVGYSLSIKVISVIFSIWRRSLSVPRLTRLILISVSITAVSSVTFRNSIFVVWESIYRIPFTIEVILKSLIIVTKSTITLKFKTQSSIVTWEVWSNSSYPL